MSNTPEIKRVLDRLRGALGTGETPPGSNSNFIVKWYNENVAKIGNGPWCEMTITWAMHTGGAKELKVGRAYTVWACEDFINGKLGGKWVYGTKGMKAGDQVYFDWKGQKNRYGAVDHTGMVEKINGDGTYYILEGNTSNNKLERRLRDGKFIVGYGRFDWARLEKEPEAPKPNVPTTPKPTEPNKPPVKPAPDVSDNGIVVQRFQRSLEVKLDGVWGAVTDKRALLMQTASQAKVGFPKNVKRSFDIRRVQAVIDTDIDGVWGPKSQKALVSWVKEFQKLLGVTADGEWGPATNNAFLKARVKHRKV